MDTQVLEVKNVITSYPKVEKLLVEWELGEIKKQQQKAVEGLTNYTLPEIPEKHVKQIIYMGYAAAPRFLYNFFDSQNLYICVIRAIGGFTYEVNGVRKVDYINFSREETEKAAFLEGFDLLENKKE